MFGLGKEIDDIRDACLESERNTRTLLDESRKENDRVSAITFRLRYFLYVSSGGAIESKSNGAIMRRDTSLKKMKEEERKKFEISLVGEMVSLLPSYEIIDFIYEIPFRAKILKVGLGFCILREIRKHFDKSTWDVQRNIIKVNFDG